MLNTLENLFKLARDRKNNPVEGSYTNKLLNNKSLSKEKILEEIIVALMLWNMRDKWKKTELGNY